MIGISLGIALLAATVAHADTTDTQTFSVLITAGTLAGDTFNGSYTWDASVSTDLTSFNFNLPGWVDATTNQGATLADLNNPSSDGVGLDLFYAPAPIGSPDAFAFFGGTGPYADFFTYGTTLVVNGEFSDAGSGEVTYGAITSSGATPEPGTFLLLASGLAAGFGAVRRKLKV
jgi:hypothetical protein